MAVPLCHWLSPLWGGHYASPIEKPKLAEAGGLPWLIPHIVRIFPEICHLDLVIGPQNPIFPLHQGTGNRAQAKSSPHLFCMAHKLKIVFTFLNNWKKKNKRRGTFHDTGTFYKAPISRSISKVVVGHSHAHSFLHCLWLLSCFKGRGEQLSQRPFKAHKLKCSVSGPFQKQFTAPWSAPWGYHSQCDPTVLRPMGL